MASSINASTSSGIVQTADTSGILNLQSNGTTVASVSSTGVAVIGNITASGATGGIGPGPACSAYPSSNQTLSSATTTKILYQTEEFDTNSNFASSTFTPTVAGYYQVSAAFEINTTLCNGSISLYKNGSIYKRLFSVGVLAGDTFGGSCLVFLNGTTDYIEIYGFISVGQALSALSDRTFFQAAMVRSA